MSDDDTEYALILAFDTDDPEFTRGFEAGMLWQRIRSGQERINVTILASNAEMVMRMAEAQGYSFAAEELPDDWMAVVLEPTPAVES
jgi:hypothetical protein